MESDAASPLQVSIKAIHSKQQSNSANIGKSCENFKLMIGLANERPTIEHVLPQLAAPWFVGVPAAVVLAPSWAGLIGAAGGTVGYLSIESNESEQTELTHYNRNKNSSVDIHPSNTMERVGRRSFLWYRWAYFWLTCGNWLWRLRLATSNGFQPTSYETHVECSLVYLAVCCTPGSCERLNLDSAPGEEGRICDRI